MSEDDPELDALRKKRLQQLQMQGQQDEMTQEEKARIDEQKKAMLRKIMTSDARERLGRLKLAYPDMTEAIEGQLIMLHRSGRLPSKIDDETLKKLLQQLQPKKREINITRK
ncbi:MAG: DNA-binding protein [Thermoplasmatota archaeon]